MSRQYRIRTWQLVVSGVVLLAVGVVALLWPSGDPGSSSATDGEQATVSSTPVVVQDGDDLAPMRPVPDKEQTTTTAAPSSSTPSATPAPSPETVRESETAPQQPTDTSPDGEDVDLHGHGDEPVEEQATATPRDQAQADRFADYETVAVAFLTDFARPPAGTPEGQWWSAVEPHLAPRVVEDFVGVDPWRVPFTEVTGDPAVMPRSSDIPMNLLMVVRVPTDGGDYLVDLQTDADGIWVTYARPAQEEQR